MQLTESNLPAHDHTVTIGNVSGSGSTWEHFHYQNSPSGSGTQARMVTWSGGSGSNGMAVDYEAKKITKVY